MTIGEFIQILEGFKSSTELLVYDYNQSEPVPIGGLDWSDLDPDGGGKLVIK